MRLRMIILTTGLLLFAVPTYAQEQDTNLTPEVIDITESTTEDDADIVDLVATSTDITVEEQNNEDNDVIDITSGDADVASFGMVMLGASYDDDEDYGDDEGDEGGETPDDGDDEEPPKPPEEITLVNVVNIQTMPYSYRAPKYTAVVDSGNVRVSYEQWTCEDGRVNRSNGDYDEEPRFWTFEEGKAYFYTIKIIANDRDYFTSDTVFNINGSTVKGALLSQNTVYRVTGLYPTVSTCGHAYTTYTDPATCTTKGRKYKKCKYCSREQTLETIPAKGHTYGDPEVIEPTCTKQGEKKYSCENCEYIKYEYIPPTGHHFVHDKDESVEPTCEKDGYKLYACTNDGCDSFYKEDVPRTGHHILLDKDESVDSTCTKEGYKVFACVNEGCGYSYAEPIPKKEHDFAYDLDSSTPATCEKDGLRVYVCVNDGCKESYAVKVPKTGHNFKYDEETSKAPTCTVAGYYNYVCTNEECNASQKKPIPATGHRFAPTVLKVATGTKTGLYCEACVNDDCEETKNNKTIFPFKSIRPEKESYAYTGKAIKPPIKVYDSAGRVIDPQYYVVVYYSNTNVGTGKIHVTFSRMYSGTLQRSFKITKASQTITTSASSYTVKNAKKKTQTVKLGASAKTTLSYTSSNKKYVTVSKGKVTVKKGTPKGTYTITIKAKSTNNYKAKTKKVKIVVKS